MEIEVNQPVKVKLKTISVHAKIRDAGIYTLTDIDGNKIKEIDGYVPDFFPDDHYGDYLIFDINIETGMIENWVKPTPEQVKEFINRDDDN